MCEQEVLGRGRCFYAGGVDVGLALHNCKCNVSGCCVMLLPLPLPLRSGCCIGEFRIVFAGQLTLSVSLALTCLLENTYWCCLSLCVTIGKYVCNLLWSRGRGRIQCVCMFTAYYVTYCLRTVVVVFVVIVVFFFGVHLASC